MSEWVACPHLLFKKLKAARYALARLQGQDKLLKFGQSMLLSGPGLWAGTALFQEFSKQTDTKRKRKGTWYKVYKPFQKCGVVPLAIYIQIWEGGAIVDLRQWVLFRKGFPLQSTTAKLEGSTMLHGRLWALCQHTRFKGKIPSKRMEVCIEHIKHSKNWDSFLELGEENDHQKKKAREKGPCVEGRAGLYHPGHTLLWNLFSVNLWPTQ